MTESFHQLEVTRRHGSIDSSGIASDYNGDMLQGYCICGMINVVLTTTVEKMVFVIGRCFDIMIMVDGHGVLFPALWQYVYVSHNTFPILATGFIERSIWLGMFAVMADVSAL